MYTNNKDELENESKYIEHSDTIRDGKWATEVEILTAAKCFRWDIFTYYQNKWQ